MLGKSEQFLKYEHGIVDTQKIPYDYMSIMHYGKDYFAKLDASKRHYLTTIETKDTKYQQEDCQIQTVLCSVWTLGMVHYNLGLLDQNGKTLAHY